MCLIILLPSEVLEHILFYLNSDDIYSWTEATDIELSDSFWKKICLRDGVVDEEETITDSTRWREEYFTYLNWKKGNYERRYFLCANQPVKLHESNIFIPSGDKFSVWNIDDDYSFLDDLPTKKVYTFGSHVVSVQGDLIHIYKYNCAMYSHFKTIIAQNKLIKIMGENDKWNFNSKNEISVSMNGNYLVFYQHKFKLLTVLNTADDNFTNFDTDCSFLFDLNVCYNSVYTLLLKCNKYILNKFKLTSKIWNTPVVISQNAAGILVPKLKYNEKLIVSLITFFVSSYNTLKIMNCKGDGLKTIQIDANLTWFCLENNYVIYPSATSVVQVWNYNKPETIEEIQLDQGFKSGNTVSCVLVILYEHYLDIYNYQQCCQLYRINFDEPKLTPLINKWYCVLIGSKCKCVFIFDFKKGKENKYYENKNFNVTSLNVC